MQAAAAQTGQADMPMPAFMIAGNDDDQPENQVDLEDDLMKEAMSGLDRLKRMTHTELREVISSRVALLDSELREREARRAVLQEARLASRILDMRRERAKRIYRNVNIGSALAAVASTVVIIAVLF